METQACMCQCHESKKSSAKKAPRKKREGAPSEKQLAAQAKFKTKVAEAQKIRAEHPDKKMSECMKIAYGK